MKYLETGSVEPEYNLAFEEWVLLNLTDDDYLMLWQNDCSVIIGQNQNTMEEIDPAFVEKHGIRVVRRTTGGGAVYHDLGNLNYSYITDYDRERGTDMSVFTGLTVSALVSMGLPASPSGRNDILIDGKKVSGTAQRIVKAGGRERILYHGTLLFHSDPAMIAGALRPDPLKFSSRATKSVRSRVGNISDWLPGVTLAGFWERLKSTYSGLNPVEASEIVDLASVERLRKEKYDTYEWNYGRSPVYEFMNKRRFSGGILDVRLHIEGGRIRDAVIFGDFLSLRPSGEMAELLSDVKYEKQAVLAVLSGIPAADYLGTITPEEFMETVFPS